MTGATTALSGRRIVLTRPVGQNEALAARIRALGGEALVYPALVIRDIDDLQPLEHAAAQLNSYDLAIFISPNAVERAMRFILARRPWPTGLRAATVGQASAAALHAHGVTEVIAPQARFDSEHLLALLPADMSGERVVVFRGQGGRELLGDTLQARGAQVDYVTCYRRERPIVDEAALGSSQVPIDAFVVTSSEGLRNLLSMLGSARLATAELFVSHARIADQARALGLGRIVVTAPGDDGLISALAQFWAKV